MDPATASVFVALIAAVASVITAFVTTRDRKKVKETHRAVTVNHHSSENPTVLDMIADLGEKIDRHIEWHLHKEKK